jgi:hypothetical protein
MPGERLSIRKICELLRLRWEHHRGVGKSWLAGTLGHKACREGFSVLYRRAQRLFAGLASARGEGRLTRPMRNLERTRLLIIDDWGPEPLNAEQRRDLLEIVDDRERKGSLLITSEVPIDRWACSPLSGRFSTYRTVRIWGPSTSVSGGSHIGAESR